MSRQLPATPNLKYLKKQAKELLRRTQQGKLADAGDLKTIGLPNRFAH
jgi:hypothetical protein